jgi:hypothetical protein
MPDQPPDEAWPQLGAEPGLCRDCQHVRLNQTRRGPAYLRCTRAEWDPALPRYPRLPVIACPGYERAAGP